MENDLISSTPKAQPKKTLGLCDIFSKVVDVGRDVKKEIVKLDEKCLNQFDNITSRINALERAFQAFNGNVAVLEANLEDKVLKSDPAFTSLEGFNDMMAYLDDENYKKRLIKELDSIGGSSVQAHISNIMKRCFNNETMKKFTLKGQGKDKGNFASTPFYRCLTGEYFYSIL